ncbi:MAG TPA: hypothetical protein VJ652_12795, partial [Noviherbaspirillum sp.]|nr:hypothetical protein [Noviherbaspirillum sp.]
LLLINQCAEMASTARGRGSARPNSRHAAVNRLVSNVFIGLPCPINAAGIVVAGFIIEIPKGISPKKRKTIYLNRFFY